MLKIAKVEESDKKKKLKAFDNLTSYKHLLSLSSIQNTAPSPKKYHKKI